MIGAKSQAQQGFTLVEMMVAITVFATATVMITNLFLVFNRAQRRAEASQNIQSDARQVLATMVDRVRSGEIDYAYYATPVANPETELAIVASDGFSYLIRRSDTDFANTVCPTAASTPCLEISNDGGATFSAMTSESLKVVGVQFYISPVESPLTESSPGVYAYDEQPRVTMVIGLQGTSSHAAEQGTTFVQTTVSSRVLLR